MIPGVFRGGRGGCLGLGRERLERIAENCDWCCQILPDVLKVRCPILFDEDALTLVDCRFLHIS